MGNSILDPAFFAAICSAVVGGAVTGYLQKQALDHEAAQQKREREDKARAERESALERDATLAFSILLKLGAILTIVADVHNLLHDAFVRSLKDKITFPWRLHRFPRTQIE